MTNFNNKPCVEVKQSFDVWKGWDAICQEINEAIANIMSDNKLIVIETYQGVIDEELIAAMQAGLHHHLWINTRDFMKSEEEVKQMIYPDVTDDRIFGALSRLNISDFLDQDKILRFQELMGENQGDNHHLWRWSCFSSRETRSADLC
jgi:hypothetical protein